MKTLSIAAVVLAAAAFAPSAHAQLTFAGGRHTYTERHCAACVALFENTRHEQREVRRFEQVPVGYRDEIVGYEDVIVRYENVWVTKTVTEYETRTVVKRVYVGRDKRGHPVYRNQRVVERVPVCRTIRVCEQRPVCEKRPIIEKRPIFETREVVTCETVPVTRGLYVCAR